MLLKFHSCLLYLYNFSIISHNKFNGKYRKTGRKTLEYFSGYRLFGNAFKFSNKLCAYSYRQYDCAFNFCVGYVGACAYPVRNGTFAFQNRRLRQSFKYCRHSHKHLDYRCDSDVFAFAYYLFPLLQ